MDYVFDPDEKRLTLSQAARDPRFKNPSTGKAAHVCSLFRYATLGGRDLSGNRVKLPTERHPAGYRTAQTAIDWFFDRLNERHAPSPRSSRREAELKSVDSGLAAAGLM